MRTLGECSFLAVEALELRDGNFMFLIADLDFDVGVIAIGVFLLSLFAFALFVFALLGWTFVVLGLSGLVFGLGFFCFFLCLTARWGFAVLFGWLFWSVLGQVSKE